MSDANQPTLVMDKARLRSEFHQLRRALERYQRALAARDPAAGAPGADRSAGLVRALRDAQLTLLQSRVSLGSLELVAALLRAVLGRLSGTALRFQPRAGAVPANGDAAGPSAATLLAWLRSAAQSAPLELQGSLQRLLGALDEFFAALDGRSGPRVVAALTRLNLVTANAQSRSVLREIAIVTRDIYRRLRAVSDELPLDALSQSSSGISEAVQRLNSVMARLDDAATQNLDSLEQANRIAQDGHAALGRVIATLRDGQKRMLALKLAHPALEAPLTQLQERLSDAVGGPVMTLQHGLHTATDQHMELISNQGFQELTSRTLKKIVDFVQALEAQLLDLLAPYRDPGGAAEPAPAQGAAATAAAGGGQQTQVDVDRLLGELGF